MTQHIKEQVIPFEQLKSSDLIIDCVYQSGKDDHLGSEVISRLVPFCQNTGGFRWVKRRDPEGKLKGLPAYVVLYTSMEELAWPDYLDVESGVFHYYGDNREAGCNLHDKKGNRFLNLVFGMLNNGDWKNIPPILIFRKTGHRRDVRFLGLAAPGNPKLSSDQDLVAFWRTMGNVRFQNYEAYFTVLDTRGDVISRKWLESLISNHEESINLAPKVWREFVMGGRQFIRALKAPRINHIPSPAEQLQCTEMERNIINAIHSYYARDKNFAEFEACAADVVMKMDPNFEKFELTRPWRDGGRDALGVYRIGTGFNHNMPLTIDCALEAKCYQGHAVGVREMSRLISRIRYRQFGILVTTSWVDSQAYEEVVSDGHPIMIVTGADIAKTLTKYNVTSGNLDSYLRGVGERFSRKRKLLETVGTPQELVSNRSCIFD